ncbi:MAG: hypothetical protein KatS3mg061_3419 [Dehalococcoidia bacterium]|nr:MAG: hypothetical protein KatS3mg061_3419 [Dehalococcoidia bacterium]
MIYLSELLRCQVTAPSGQPLGRLVDVIVRTDDPLSTRRWPAR